MKKERIKEVEELVRAKKSLNNICKQLELDKASVIGYVIELKEQGLMVDYAGGEIIYLKEPVKNLQVYEIPYKVERMKLLMISDTHLASKYDRLDILRYLYAKAEDKGVSYVLHSGDLTDGRSNRPEQIYGLKECSYTGQRDYVVDKYPRSSVPTYMISGNHDLWWIKNCGSDIVRDICEKREDLHYLGSDCEDLKIGKLKIRLYHGKGGSAYAKSYKLQKYLDQIAVNERPDILQTGHIHQAFFYKQDNTHCFQTSCLQDLTPYERSMGFSNNKSCWWANIEFDNKGNVLNVTPTLETFEKKIMVVKK